MSKKNFKDNTVNTGNTQAISDTEQTQNKPYRLNVKLRSEFRQYLDDEAWKARMSITEYLNNLIQADMDKKKEIEKNEQKENKN
jgi:hypothetical protein